MDIADGPEPSWASDYNREQDALEAYTLARYIKAGHPYTLAMRSGIATPYLKPGQYLFFARLDASSEFWRMHAAIKRELEQRKVPTEDDPGDANSEHEQSRPPAVTE